MKVLIITANLASPIVKKETSKSKHKIHVHVVNTPIAAFLTPKRIVEELVKYGRKHELNEGMADHINTFDLDDFDLILTPGLVRKDVAYVKEKTGIETYKGPTDAADLSMVLDLIENLNLSTKISADKFIEEEQRKKALNFIQEFENNQTNIKKLLKKPENILVGNLPVGEDFQIGRAHV